MMPRQILLITMLAGPLWAAPGAQNLELKPNDRICLIGNALPDRMQHAGYLEALIHQRYPKHNLVWRNLGFAGDEIDTRLRSEGFGTPDEWLKREQADVIFAFFGYNESWQGPEGLERFRRVLGDFITNTISQNYNGKGAPRLVLFSPTAAEKHPDPNFPAADPLNHNLKYYVDAMAEVARAHQVMFIDLFTPSAAAYAQAREPLTINAVHLKDIGYQALAAPMFRALFDAEPSAGRGTLFEKLRAAVDEKNEMWFSRYRTMDGYNVYGGRSYLKFDGVMNRDTMQREMSMRDVMTANRDQRVWAIAQGGDLKVTDDNLPAPVTVPSNKPGKNPDGTHIFLTGEAAISRMKVPPGCRVNLFASEEQFPELANPVQMGFDTRGRLWVAAWPNYPERTPQSKKGDSLLVFEDLNADGKADRCVTFVEDLNCPTGFQFYRDGVILVQAPDVWFLRDTNGDGKADWRERVLNGLDSADSHHTANALVLDPGGAIYLSDGVFHRTTVETAWGPPVRNLDAAIYRFEPRAAKFETYIAYGFANPHGRVFDRWGNDLVTDATGNATYFGPAFSGRIDYPSKHPSLRQFWERPSRPCPGTGMLSSRHFPAEFQGNFLNCNVIGFQGIFRVKVKEEGSGLWGETIEPALVQSDDPNFRPSAVDVAPDGSVYFLDWHNPIIGHMQHHLRDPNRGHSHGRVYRMTYEGRPLLRPARIAGEPIDKLLDLLTEPEDNVRTRAKIELGARETRPVLAAVEKWMRRWEAKNPEHQHHLLEALWVHQWHNVVNEALLRQMLQSPEARARAAAVRVAGYWRDRIDRPLALLQAAANDGAPRVRLEAARVASFFQGPEALDIAYDILKYDTDYYLDYTFKETTRQLQKSVKDVYLPKDPRALGRVVGGLTDQQLLMAPPVEPVLMARLERRGVDLSARSLALDALAKLRATDPITEGVAALRRLDAGNGAVAPAHDLAFLLSAQATNLSRVRPALVELAKNGAQPAVRRAGYATLVAAEGNPAAAWQETASQPAARAALIDSISMQSDPAVRVQFDPLLNGLLTDAQAPEVVRVAALRALPLMGAERAPQNFRVLARQVREGRDLSVAGRAIMQLPRDAWVAEEAPAVAQAILAWAQSVPAGKRTAPEFVETIQLGMEVGALLPQAEATRIGKELLGLGVRVFAIKTVREQMRYDTTRIVVEAGKPFEIVLENTDMMPHNLVVVEPGAREEIGLLAQSMPPEPNWRGLWYTPDNKKIIAASKMLEPGQKETMKLTAPQTPGDYEYVCTYPEHWKVMFGQLIVVKDIDAYLAQPRAAAAKSARHAHAH